MKLTYTVEDKPKFSQETFKTVTKFKFSTVE